MRKGQSAPEAALQLALVYDAPLNHHVGFQCCIIYAYRLGAPTHDDNNDDDRRPMMMLKLEYLLFALP